MHPVREIRSIHARELRVVRSDDGKQYLTGYAAKYNVLSSDLGYFRERIIPGTFTRAIAEKQDVRHLVNHDPNLVLGRTAAGTTELSEDSTGLAFKTLLGNRSYERDLAESVDRGDVNECSFGFIVKKSRWLDDETATDPSMRNIRELLDVDLFDVSSVTYPAYPQTNTELSSRSLFPDGIPAEIRSHIRDAKPAGVCMCDCDSCKGGDCEGCTNEDCDDENCRCAMRSKRGKSAKTKKVDGEDLTSDCFLIVGDKDDTSTWKLPWKFSTEEKTKTHLQNALARWNQLKGVSEDDKAAAWKKLVKLCKKYGIEVSEESSLRRRLTDQQFAELRDSSGSDAADLMQMCQSAAHQCKINVEEIMQAIARAVEDPAAAMASCQDEFQEIARIAQDMLGRFPDDIVVDEDRARMLASAKVRVILASL